MKKLLILSFYFCCSGLLFSQTAKTINLDDCIEQALLHHPLQPKSALYQQQLKSQHTLQDKKKLPEISWNAKARIQSESLGLEFDNPMIPSIDIPLYSSQTTLDLNYMIYDGGASSTIKNLQNAKTEVLIEQNKTQIDQIKQQVIAQYLGLLFLQQKEKVLQASLDLILDNIQTLSEAKKFGVVDKSDIQQLQLKKLELEAAIRANQTDRSIGRQLLSEITGLTIDADKKLDTPSNDKIQIDDEIDRSKLHIFDLQNQLLEVQKETITLDNQPRVFAYVSTGAGYPNPLNFFDDSFSLFAVGGLGFSWHFYDWGADKEERQQIQIQQELIQTEKTNLETQLNRMNSRYELGIAKNQQLIEDETAMISIKKQLAETQRKRLEKGIIIPLEYLDNLNDIMQSEIKLNQYKLEIIKLKLEYQLLKGKI